MKHLPRKFYLALPAIVLVLALGSGALVYWRTKTVWRTERQTVESESVIKFASRQITPLVDSGFEWLSTPAQFREAAQFKGLLYVASANGLTEYDAQGHSLREFLVGRELPSSPLTRLITGVLPDSRTPELIIGTDGAGVLVFNGSSFRQILPEQRDAQSVTSLLVISSGQLLIGTRKAGVLVYDGHELKPFHATLTNLAVTELAGDNGELWVGSGDRGVAHWHGGITDWFGEANGLPDAHVYAIAVAGDEAFVGTAAGVAEFHGGQFVRVLAKGAFVRALFVGDKSLLVGTMDDGLLTIPLANGRRGRAEQERLASLGEVHQLFAAGGESLVAVSDSGVFARSGSASWRKIVAPTGTLLTDGNISALAVDGAGKLWVGYFDRGLDLVDLRSQRVQHIEDDHVFCVNRVLPNARKGTTAVATANGLVLFDEAGQRRQVLGRKDGLIADHVTDVAAFGDGMVLATPAGLTFLDSGGARSLYAFHGLVNNHVYTLALDGNRLLAGTLGGATLLDGDHVQVSYTTATSTLKHNWITAAVSDPARRNASNTGVSGGFWLGTYGAGVVYMDDSGHFQAADGAAGNLVVNPGAMVADEQIVAAGTLGRGLYVMDQASGRWRAITNGLPSLNVTALTVSNGYLYVGTDNGLVRIAERRLLQ